MDLSKKRVKIAEKDSFDIAIDNPHTGETMNLDTLIICKILFDRLLSPTENMIVEIQERFPACEISLVSEDIYDIMLEDEKNPDLFHDYMVYIKDNDLGRYSLVFNIIKLFGETPFEEIEAFLGAVGKEIENEEEEG